MNRAFRAVASLSFSSTTLTLILAGATLGTPLWAQQTAVKAGTLQTANQARAAKKIPSNSINMTVVKPGEAPEAAEDGAAPALSAADKALVEQQRQFLQENRVSLVEDWTTKTVVASDPGPEEESIRNGTHDHWLAVVNEPRYIMHALRHHLPVRGPGPAALLKFEQDTVTKAGETWVGKDREYEPPSIIKAHQEAAEHPGAPDWAVALGGAGVAATMYPAKFDYDAGAPSCTKDYVVVGVNAAGSATQAEIVGINNVYSFCNGGTPTVMFAYHTSFNGTVKTSPALSLDGTKIAFVESIAAASRLNILTIGTTGSNGTVAAPALPGTGNNASIVSILMKGGHQDTRSSVFVDYNEDINPCDTAFVGDDNGYLHAFTPVFNTKNATGGACAPAAPAEILTCGTAACQQGGWPLYTTQGALTALTGPSYDPVSKNVFFGTAGTEGGLELYARTVAASAGVCVNAAGTQTGAPPCMGGFYDATAAVYVQAYGYGNNAFTYDELLTQAVYGDYQDPPLVDIYTQYTFWPTGSSYCYPGLGGACSVCGAPLVTQISTNFNTNPAIICGGSTAGNHLHLGAFDNAYYTSTATGNMWIGFPDFIGATAGVPALGLFCFGNTSAACSGSGAAANVIGAGYEITPTGLGALASSAQDASPVTEEYDVAAGIDWMTISTTGNSCGGAGSNGACIWANNISPSASPFTCAGAACSYIPWTPNTVYVNGSEVVDTNGNLQKITSVADAGTSYTVEPAWQTSGVTLDGTPSKAMGYGIVVTNNIVPAVSTTATASFTFTGQPQSWETSAGYPGILYANGGFDFDCAAGSVGVAGVCTSTDYYNGYNVTLDRVILIGDTLAHTVQNVVAAINSLPSSSCGYTDPTVGDGVLFGTCYYPAYNQVDVTASSSGNTVTLTARVSGTGGNGTGGTGRLTGCFQNYGFEPEDYYETDPNDENITPFADTCLTGGTGSAVSTLTVEGQVISPSEPTYASGTGTFTADPTNGTTVTINNPLAGTQTITASIGVSASAIATFSGKPVFGQGATITNGANTLSLMATPGTPAVGTITAISNPSGWATGTVTLTVGSVTYTFVTSATPALNQIRVYTGSTAAANEAATMQNVWAALSGMVGYCANATCINASQTANPAVTSNFLGQGYDGAITGLALTSNTPGAAGNFALSTSTTADLTVVGGNNGGNGPNSCGSATNGTFVIGATTAASATNFGAAINACNTAYPAIGVTATVGTGANTCGGTTMTTSQVCVLASASGTGGNSIGLGTLTGAVAAHGTANLNTTCAANGNTLTIGTVYTQKTGAINANNQIKIPTNCYYSWASSNLAATLDDAVTLCSTATCVFATQTLNQAFGQFSGTGPDTGATAAGEVVTVTAFDPGTVGNAYGFATSVATNYTLVPATGTLAGGVNGASGAMTGFAWSGCVPATTLCGGSGSGNPATTYAVGGGATSDAANLTTVINGFGNAALLGVTASSASGVVTLTASTPGTGGNGITLATTSNPNFTWNSATLAGGSSGTTTGNTFAFWGPSSELSAGNIAGNIVTAINSNATLAGLNPSISAANTSGVGCVSNCEFTLTASANGTAANSYTLATTFANTTFYWNCPLGTSTTDMCGGATGVTWTYQSPGNGEDSTPQQFGTSGMVIESLDFPAWIATHGYAIKSGITDSNGNNQLAIIGGTSGSGTPSWSTVPGSLTHDGTVTWQCLGEASAANLYLGTLTGVGGNKVVKYTVNGLQ